MAHCCIEAQQQARCAVSPVTGKSRGSEDKEGRDRTPQAPREARGTGREETSRRSVRNTLPSADRYANRSRRSSTEEHRRRGRARVFWGGFDAECVCESKNGVAPGLARRRGASAACVPTRSMGTRESEQSGTFAERKATVKRRRGERCFCRLAGATIMGDQAGKACSHRPGLFMSGGSGETVCCQRATRW